MLRPPFGGLCQGARFAFAFPAGCIPMPKYEPERVCFVQYKIGENEIENAQAGGAAAIGAVLECDSENANHR